MVFPAAGKTEVKNITVVRLYQYYKKHECIRNNIPECMVISGRRQEGEDLIYPKCGDIITEIGKEVVRILEIIPAQMVVRKDIHFTYDYQTDNNEDIEAPVVKTPREKNIIPGIFATSEVIAHIITYRAP